MGAITLPNFRTTADVTMNTRLKDGGVSIDWAGLTDIKAWLYSDVQKAIAGRWENPEWTALGLTGTVDDTTTAIMSGGAVVRRWIYTDVAEFVVHVHYGFIGGASLGYLIGFEGA